MSLDTEDVSGSLGLFINYLSLLEDAMSVSNDDAN
tara:strand:+ start:1232 stop:1336 length:105 start_codon:yes stop_codon:yes gene_type:complete